MKNPDGQANKTILMGREVLLQILKVILRFNCDYEFLMKGEIAVGISEDIVYLLDLNLLLKLPKQ